MKIGRKKNIVMIADDDLFIRKLIRAGLGGMAEFIEVDNGADVEKNYVNHEPDILFLDIHLPNKSGMDIISQICAVDNSAYIIMLSSDSSPENVKRAIEMGAKGFMSKPFKKDRLLQYFSDCPTIAFQDT